MTDFFELADELGPLKTIHIHEPSVGVRGVLVVDNVAIGPSIGGLRMAPDVSTEECVRLARAMTLKNAAAGLRHGGGKSVLFGDPKMPKSEKQRLIRGFASVLRRTEEYIFGPTWARTRSAWLGFKTKSVVPSGCPERSGAFRSMRSARRASESATSQTLRSNTATSSSRARASRFRGFGAVGMHAARFLADKGAVLVAASDSRGAIHDPAGLEVPKLIELKSTGASVAEYKDAQALRRDEIIDVECEIWIPAARPDVIREDNVDRLKAKLVIQGANIPITEGAEHRLADRGVLNVPDFIANAGGVICAAVEYQGATEAVALATIEEKLRNNTARVLHTAKNEHVLPRQAAVQLARARVREAMRFRRFFSFSTAPGFS